MKKKRTAAQDFELALESLAEAINHLNQAIVHLGDFDVKTGTLEGVKDGTDCDSGDLQ